MPRVGSRSGARVQVLAVAPLVSGVRVSALGGTIIVASIVLMSAGCAAFPSGEAQATRTPPQSSPTATPSDSAQPGAPESLGFADGAQLDPLAKVGWQFAFLAADDAAWTSNPADDPYDETSFINADDTCTAYYFQEIFDTATVDDRSASDEYLAEVSGATTGEVATYAEDGYFALTHVLMPEPADGEVASRNILAESDEETLLVAARVFTNMDYTTSQMNNAYSLQLACDAGIDPMTQLDSLDEIAKIVVDQ